MTSKVDQFIETFVELIPPDSRSEPEKKADKIYKRILKYQYADAIDLLKTLEKDPKIWFKRESGKSLVTACKDARVPKELIELLLDKGVNEFVPQPPDPFDAVEAMIPPAVAAENGNINALEVFMSRNMYSIPQWQHAAIQAYLSGDHIASRKILNHRVTIIDANGETKTEIIHSTFKNFRSQFPMFA